jgi:hypothetical protein
MIGAPLSHAGPGTQWSIFGRNIGKDLVKKLVMVVRDKKGNQVASLEVPLLEGGQETQRVHVNYKVGQADYWDVTTSYIDHDGREHKPCITKLESSL